MKNYCLLIIATSAIFIFNNALAQDIRYQWVAYDTIRSDMDTAADGSPARYIQQYDTAKMEKISDSRFFLWTRAMPISTKNKMSWMEHQVMPDSLYSGYSYAAFKIEIDCREKRYKTWQWMYYDDRDNPVSGLKLSIERPVGWNQLTPTLKKMLLKTCNLEVSASKHSISIR
jgi:hypothetical protein